MDEESDLIFCSRLVGLTVHVKSRLEAIGRISSELRLTGGGAK